MRHDTIKIMVACNNENGLIVGHFDAICFATSLGVSAEVSCPRTIVR